MNRITVFLIFFMSLSLFACEDKNDIPTTMQPTETESAIAGSFVGKFLRFSQGERYEGKPITEWNDTVWRNERINQQVMIWTADQNLDNIDIVVSDLVNGENVISNDNVKLRYVDYVKGDELALGYDVTGERPGTLIGDALSDEKVSRILTDDPLKVWISVDIPKDIPSGRYSGTLSVNQGQSNLLMFDICFIVANRTLPDVKDWNFHLDLWQFPFQLPILCGNIEPFSSDYYQLISPFYALLADAGQKGITTYIKDGAFVKGQTMIDWKLLKDGNWRFDYTNFDSYVEFMMGLGIDKQINCFSLGGWVTTVGYTDEASGKYLTKAFRIGDAEYNNTWNCFLNDFYNHLQQKGWFEKVVLYMDENTDAEMEKIVDLINNNNVGWKIGLAGREINNKLERKIYDYSTIINYNRKSTNNGISTFYTSCSQKHPNNFVTIETEPAEMTWMAWHALAGGFDGYVRWAFDYWTQDDPFDARDGSNSAGDYHMIYRSSNSANAKPVSSIRFELLRDGIQDFEKVKILGESKMRDVISLFTDSEVTTVTDDVKAAEAKIKQMSLK